MREAAKAECTQNSPVSDDCLKIFRGWCVRGDDGGKCREGR